MELIIILAAGATALLVLATAIGMIAFSDGGFNAGMARLARPGRSVPSGPRTSVNVTDRLHKLGAQLGKGAMEGRRRENVRIKLIRGGFYAERAVEIFYAIRILAALGLGAAAILAAVVLRAVGSPLVLTLIMVAVAVGLFGPNLILASRISSRARAVKIGLPDAVDLMVVCAEAGGTLVSAIQRVTREFGSIHPVLAEQFQIMLDEMQAGSSRADALQRLGLRAPTDEVRSLVTLLIQSEALGASIGQALRVFAEEMRKARYIEAERKAGELPVKMAFPLVLGIFPALFTVIFVPLVIRLMRVVFTTAS